MLSHPARGPVMDRVTDCAAWLWLSWDSSGRARSGSQSPGYTARGGWCHHRVSAGHERGQEAWGSEVWRAESDCFWWGGQ